MQKPAEEETTSASWMFKQGYERGRAFGIKIGGLAGLVIGFCLGWLV